MKHIITTLCIICSSILMTACDESDSDTGLPTYYRIPVSVLTDEITGATYFVSDNDATLRPTNAYLASQLNGYKRALISFEVIGDNSSLIESGKTYNISLVSGNGSLAQIPTFDTFVDTGSEEYKKNGQDSIASHDKHIAGYKDNGTPYIRGGYLTLIASFYYSTDAAVYFALHNDMSSEVCTEKGKLSATLHLYFENSTQSPLYGTSSYISLQAPDELYDAFRSAGRQDSDTVLITFTAETSIYGEETTTIVSTVGELVRIN